MNRTQAHNLGLSQLCILEERLPVAAGTEHWAYPRLLPGSVRDTLYGVAVEVRRSEKQRYSYYADGKHCTLDALLARLETEISETL